MTILKIHSLNGIVFGLLCLALTGCGTTKPSQFYLLTSIENDSASIPSIQKTENIQIGLGPISFPKYLDRLSIVKRSTDSEVIIDEMHRWAESLEGNFTRVLADNLSALLNGVHIATYPMHNWKEIDYQVILNVSRFDADINGNIILSAHWDIRSKAGKKNLYSHKSLINEKAGNDDYPALVRTQSKVTEKLSREIANKLKEIIMKGN